MQIATNESTVLQINHITTLKGMGKKKELFMTTLENSILTEYCMAKDIMNCTHTPYSS